MGRSNVLFSLKPGNITASEIVNLDSNRHLVPRGEQVLDIGHYRSEAERDEARCIATIGRDGDIAVPPEWTTVSRVHCAFVVGAARRCITFVDKSSNASCQAYGGEGNTQELLSSSSRQVDSSAGLCKFEIRIDGFNEPKTAEFDVVWHYPASGLISALQAWRRVALPRRPKLAVTQIWPVREEHTKKQHSVVVAAGYQASAGDIAKFVLGGTPIGRGAFGAVFKARHPTSNMVVAVKVQQPLNARQWSQLEREVQIMSELCHPNIVEFLGNRVDGAKTVAHIFMSLQNGSLEDLVNKRRELEVDVNDQSLARIAYHDILKGLDYLHWKGFIHRDLKPGNVLYTLKHNRPFFCLADFGLTNSECSARTFCGTPEFAAPEVFYHQKQSFAGDMWSLLMTIVWTLDLADYRSQTWHSYPSLLAWVIPVISEHWAVLRGVHGLAIIDSGERATAAQMLVEIFGGDGLTTDLKDVPKLRPVKAPGLGDISVYIGAVQRSAPKHDPRRINRAQLKAGALKWPDIRQNPSGRNVVPMAQILREPTRPAFPNEVPQRKKLLITNVQRRGGEKKAVHEEKATLRHPAARVAPEYAAAKQPAAPEANLVGRRLAGGVQKRKALPLRNPPLAGLKADVWFQEVFKMPGAFPA